MANARAFARWKEPENDFIPKEFIAKQKAEFDQLSEREKMTLQAERIAFLKKRALDSNDQSLWWIKL